MKKGIVSIFIFILGLGIFHEVCQAEEFSAPGFIEAWAQVTMKAKTSGSIGSVLVEEGDQVKGGSILLELDNRKEKAMIRLAEAKVAKAKAGLLEANVGLQNSKTDLDRKEVMKDVIPKKEFEDAQDLVSKCEATVSVSEGEIREAEAELQLRTAELENTLLRAPFDGVVTKIHVKKGETIRELDTPVCDVVQLDKLYVQIVVPVQFLPLLEKGMKVSIGVERDTRLFDKMFEGEVWYINPIVDPASRRVQVKVLIPNPNTLVRPGMIAEVSFPVRGQEPELKGTSQSE